MCSAAMVMGVQGMGAFSSAVGAYSGAQAQKESLNLSAEMAEINARMSESAAQATLLSGQKEEGRVRLNTAHLKSKQRVGLAANGVDLGVGSAKDILTTTDVMGELDANQIQANAVRAAWGHRTQAVNHKNQALMSRSAASAISPGLSAATSLLGSAAAVAPSWYLMSQANGGGATPPPYGGPNDGSYERKYARGQGM